MRGDKKIMNNIIVIASVVLLVLVGGGLFVANQQPKNTQEEKMAQEKAAVMMAKNASSRYIPYSKAAYDTAVGERRVLYFYATWCPSCKQANENFTANPNKIPEDVVVIRINYNDPDTNQEEKDLAKKYGITYQHTFVQVDAQGKELAKWNGGDTDELITNIK